MKAEKKPPSPMRRIAVALDASSHSLAALAEAARLAAETEAELLGVFVEDTDLWSLAELPLTGEVDSLTARRAAMDRSELARALRIQAERVRAQLVAVSSRARITYSFQVARGNVARELSKAAEQSDLLVLGRSGRSPWRHRRMGTTARALALTCRTLMLVQGGPARHGQLAVIFFEASRGERAFELAARHATIQHRRLSILLPVETPQETQMAWADRLQQQSGLEGDLQFYAVEAAHSLKDELERRKEGVVLLDASPPSIDREVFQRLLEDLPQPVILLR